MIRLAIVDLKLAANHRPPGYFEEVMRSGTVDGDYLLLSDAKFEALRQKFSSADTTPPERKPSGIEHLSSPGSLLSLLIRTLTGKDSKECMPCSQRVKQMNAWGWMGCIKNKSTIAGWLVEEAAKLGKPTDEKAVLTLLRQILRR